MSKDAMVKNTDDKNQVEKAKKRLERKFEYSKDDMKSVLETASGRRVLYEIISQGGIYREHLGETIQSMSFRCGESAMAKRVISMMSEVDPNAYPNMVIEANQK